MLPRQFCSEIQMPIVAELTFGMVGGATMSADVGLTGINWLGELREVEVIISDGDDALIGTELLIATTLTIDYSSSTLTISNGEV